jgi:tRNA (mo5U34)-methyltransferase
MKLHGITPKELQREISTRKWFHTFDLGDGITTPGADPSAAKLKALDLPELRGKSVIDIGAFDGFFSFECERRGASRVVAADHWVWNWPGVDARRNIELLRETLGSRIELLDMPVEDLSPQTAGTYDIALFLGVLYHAPDPIRYLRNVLSITKELVVVETMVDLLDIKEPAAAFYGGDAFNNDASLHWGPNRLAVEAMLKKVGFRSVEYKAMWHKNTRQELDPSARRPARGEVLSGRMVFHAYPGTTVR